MFLPKEAGEGINVVEGEGINVVEGEGIDVVEGEGTNVGAGEATIKIMGVQETPFETAFWVDVELSAIEADIKNALKSPFPTELAILVVKIKYRESGEPDTGTFNCVVASMSYVCDWIVFANELTFFKVCCKKDTNSILMFAEFAVAIATDCCADSSSTDSVSPDRDNIVSNEIMDSGKSSEEGSEEGSA